MALVVRFARHSRGTPKSSLRSVSQGRAQQPAARPVTAVRAHIDVQSQDACLRARRGRLDEAATNGSATTFISGTPDDPVADEDHADFPSPGYPTARCLRGRPGPCFETPSNPHPAAVTPGSAFRLHSRQADPRLAARHDLGTPRVPGLTASRNDAPAMLSNAAGSPTRPVALTRGDDMIPAHTDGPVAQLVRAERS
jgi:hypothetical protein